MPDSRAETTVQVLLLENIQVSEAYWDSERQAMVYRVEFTADRTENLTPKGRHGE